MSIKQLFTISLIVFCANLLMAQIAKGDAFFDKDDMLSAIPCYKKAAKSNVAAEKQQANIKLGNSYHRLNDYANAENYYRLVIESNDGLSIENNLYYQFAQVLKSNTKYEEAAKYYKIYIEKSPNDQNAKKALKFCAEINYYLSKPIEYAVKNIISINTEKAEFSPFVSNNKLMFVAESESFDFVNYEVKSTDGQPYVQMFVSEIEGDMVKKSKTLSKKLSSEFHDGPACLSADGKLLYFSRVINIEKKGFVNRSKIYTATGSNRSWKNVKVLPFCSDDYSVAHPAISYDNKTIYFTSDMPGGFGGKDLWMCVKSDSINWGPPINLGPDINTSGDEMFPAIKKDGNLYFSSNGLPGFGGLDIYSAHKIDTKWILNRNEGIQLNSSTDDFGITFLTDSTGYFSSNRKGGKGKDDIYFYKYTDLSVQIGGTILLSKNLKDVASEKKVYLYDDKGVKIDSTLTNNKGQFMFKNLASEKNYMAVLDPAELKFTSKKKIYLAQKDSIITNASYRLPNGLLGIKNIKRDGKALPDLDAEEISFAGKLFSGDNADKAMPKAKVKIVNAAGEVLGETTTDENGSFVFKNLPSNENYIVVVDDDELRLPEGTKITLANKSGKAIKSYTKAKENNEFKILASEKSVISDLAADEDINFAGKLLSGDKADNAMKRVKVKIVNAAGEVLGETVTDENGAFTFKNIPGNENYIVVIDDDELRLPEGTKITLANKAGKEMKSYNKTKDNTEQFKILASEKSIISDMMVDDEITFAGTLMLGDKATKAMKNVKVKILNQAGEVVGETTTNEFGAFAFRNIPGDQNFIVSIDEGDLQLPQGTRITITNKAGKEVKSIVKDKEENFDFKILSSDKNLIEDMDAGDANMVMGIYGFLYDQAKRPIANVHLTVKDEDGSNARKIITSPYGKFSFKNLNPEKNYIFEADANDPGMIGVKSIQIADGKGKVYRVIELESGMFSFKVLEADKNAMGEFSVDDPWMKMTEAKKREMRIKAEKELAAKKAAEAIAKQQKERDDKLAKDLALIERKNKDEAIKEEKRIRDEAAREDKRLKEEAAKEAKRLKEEELLAKKEQERLEREEALQREKDEEAAADMEISITIVENIYYAYGKFDVTDEAKTILDKAFDVLKQNNKLELEISSHTDSQSSYGFNLNLSKKRAQAAVDYLVAKGIDKSRLKPIGWGELKLLNKCVNNFKCTDEEHRVNRRTEFKIIKAKKKVKK
jgi:outer membrane protein OmpA-like peptidoglycan-associated protein